MSTGDLTRVGLSSSIFSGVTLSGLVITAEVAYLEVAQKMKT